MDANQKTDLDSEKLGRAIDELDALAHALILPMPDKFHIEQLRSALPTVVLELKAGFAEATGHNPWAF
jgi:hypothetical protein